jgi:hypothetical protein
MTSFREYCEGSIDALEAAVASFPNNHDAVAVHSAGISLESDFHCAVTLEEIIDVSVRSEVLALLGRALSAIDGLADPRLVESVRNNIAAVTSMGTKRSAIAHVVAADPDPLGA